MTKITVNAIGDYEYEGKKYTVANEIKNVIAGFDVEAAEKRLNDLECVYRDYGIDFGGKGNLEDVFILDRESTFKGTDIEEEVFETKRKLFSLPKVPEMKVCSLLAAAEVAQKKGQNPEIYLKMAARL